jgi:hypothetical protein
MNFWLNISQLFRSSCGKEVISGNELSRTGNYFKLSENAFCFWENYFYYVKIQFLRV